MIKDINKTKEINTMEWFKVPMPSFIIDDLCDSDTETGSVDLDCQAFPSGSHFEVAQEKEPRYIPEEVRCALLKLEVRRPFQFDPLHPLQSLEVPIPTWPTWSFQWWDRPKINLRSRDKKSNFSVPNNHFQTSPVIQAPDQAGKHAKHVTGRRQHFTFGQLFKIYLCFALLMPVGAQGSLYNKTFSKSPGMNQDLCEKLESSNASHVTYIQQDWVWLAALLIVIMCTCGVGPYHLQPDMEADSIPGAIPYEVYPDPYPNLYPMDGGGQMPHNYRPGFYTVGGGGQTPHSYQQDLNAHSSSPTTAPVSEAEGLVVSPRYVPLDEWKRSKMVVVHGATPKLRIKKEKGSAHNGSDSGSSRDESCLLGHTQSTPVVDVFQVLEELNFHAREESHTAGEQETLQGRNAPSTFICPKLSNCFAGLSSVVVPSLPRLKELTVPTELMEFAEHMEERSEAYPCVMDQPCCQAFVYQAAPAEMGMD